MGQSGDGAMVATLSLIGVAHSMVDFSQQIPGYMIVAFALLGIGLSQSLVPPLAVEPQEGALFERSRGGRTDEEVPEERRRRR